MQVKRIDLLRKLDMVQSGVSSRDIIEQSSCFAFTSGKVFTFNDELSCRARSGLDKKLTGAVPHKPLLELLRSLHEEEVEIGTNNGSLIIKGHRRSAGIRMDSEISLPINEVEEPQEWQEIHSDFLSAIDIVQTCAAESEEEKEYTCVHIHPKWVEACDRFQLARYRLKTRFPESTLIRRNSIKTIIGLGVTEFSITPNWIHFRNQDVEISCRKYLEQYRDLDSLLQVKGSSLILPKDLAGAAEKAAIFSSENLDSDSIMVDIKSGKIIVRGKGATGWYRETKRSDYNGREISFLIKPKMLVEIVTKYNECILSDKCLKVDGDRWSYVAWLRVPTKEAATEEE